MTTKISIVNVNNYQNVQEAVVFAIPSILFLYFCFITLFA